MVSQLGRPFGGSFPPLEARMPPSGAMRASSGRRLSGQFQLGHLGPVSRVWCLSLAIET